MRYCGVVTDRSWIDPEPDSIFSGPSLWNELIRNGNVKGFSGVIEAQKKRIYPDEVPMANMEHYHMVKLRKVRLG